MFIDIDLNQCMNFHCSKKKQQMGWQNLQQRTQNLLNSHILREPFHLLTTTLLSLLIPLSFLLLARLSSTRYILSLASYPNPEPSSFIWDFFIYSNPAILYGFVSIISIVTLIHGLTGKISPLSDPPSSSFRPTLYFSWILLCTLQVCVGLGIEGSIAIGAGGINSSFDLERSLMSRVIFLLGLHETMLYWSRVVVKPVVDDTIFDAVRKENWIERLALAGGLGSLWCWKLRDEIESLVVVAEVKMELLMGIGMSDFVGWWLYYLTVTIGMVRIVKCLMWIGMILFCRRRVRGNYSHNNSVEDDKV